MLILVEALYHGASHTAVVCEVKKYVSVQLYTRMCLDYPAHTFTLVEAVQSSHLSNHKVVTVDELDRMKGTEGFYGSMRDHALHQLRVQANIERILGIPIG